MALLGYVIKCNMLRLVTEVVSLFMNGKETYDS